MSKFLKQEVRLKKARTPSNNDDIKEMFKPITLERINKLLKGISPQAKIKNGSPSSIEDVQLIKSYLEENLS